MLLSASGVVWTLAYVVPLGALRRLGASLYRHDALSLPVASAFRWLAHPLPLYALRGIGASVLAVLASELCLGVYSIAHVMRLATEAAADARSIV